MRYIASQKLVVVATISIGQKPLLVSLSLSATQYIVVTLNTMLSLVITKTISSYMLQPNILLVIVTTEVSEK